MATDVHLDNEHNFVCLRLLYTDCLVTADVSFCLHMSVCLAVCVCVFDGLWPDSNNKLKQVRLQVTRISHHTAPQFRLPIEPWHPIPTAHRASQAHAGRRSHPSVPPPWLHASQSSPKWEKTCPIVVEQACKVSRRYLFPPLRNP